MNSRTIPSVIARSASDEAIHLVTELRCPMDCFAALAMTENTIRN